MAEHTPGPWETTGDGLSIVATNAKGPRPIVARVSDMNFAAKTRHANARLMAAAPALLAACEVALETMRRYCGSDFDEACEMLRAAIAQAKEGN